MPTEQVPPPPDVIPPDPNEPVFVITRRQWDEAKAAAGHFIPTLAKYWPMLANLIIATGLVSGGAAYVLKPSQPTTPSQPVTVNVTPNGKGVTTEPVQPSPVEPKKVEASKLEATIPPINKLIIYTLDGKEVDKRAFDSVSVLVTTDPKAWPKGTYKFNDKSVEFPAGVLYTFDMTRIVDVVHYDKIEDLVAMIKSHPIGK